MNTCDTCKHWHRYTTMGKPCNNGRCGKLAEERAYAVVEELFEVNPAEARPLNFDCPLLTGPKFGCIHHQTKE